MITAEKTSFAVIPALRGLIDTGKPEERVAEARRRGRAFRQSFLEQSPVFYARRRNLLRIPYPSIYAFLGVYAQRYRKPYMVHLMASMSIIQFVDLQGELRTLLFNPHDYETGSDTPFFRRLANRTPKFLIGAIAPSYSTVLKELDAVGLRPEQIDYITYDHLHTQNLRRWLGDETRKPVFPNARLLVHEEEWKSVQGLLPIQAEWYCPSGTEGVSESKIITFVDSILLGQGIALVHSPGHTAGNHSLVVRSPDGIRVSSENGVAADSYAPEKSRHGAIRKYALETGMEVILNGNTQESSTNQYVSMILEKEIAGADSVSGFPNVRPSSECTPYWMFPAPVSHLFSADEFGTIRL